MGDKARGARAHEDQYRNDVPLGELPRQGMQRVNSKSNNDLTAGRRDEQPRHSKGEVRLRELQSEVEKRITEPAKLRKPQEKLDRALGDTFPGSDPVAFLEPKRK